MFGQVGMGEIIVILLIVLIVFGPRRLPELARGIGKGLNEFKRAAEDVKQELSLDHHLEPPRRQQPHGTSPRQDKKQEESKSKE